MYVPIDIQVTHEMNKVSSLQSSQCHVTTVCCRVYLTVSSPNEYLHPICPLWLSLSDPGHSRRMINVPPLTPHCELDTMGRNYFSWWAGACLWLKTGANTVYHLPDDSPPLGKLSTRPYRLARAGSQCPFTLINLPVFPVQLYQSNLSEDTQHWSVNTADYCTRNMHTHTEENMDHNYRRWVYPQIKIYQRKPDLHRLLMANIFLAGENITLTLKYK